MKYALKAAREFYSYSEDPESIENLKSAGFHFEDWHNGFCEINSIESELSADQVVELAIRFGEISLTPNGILIMNWMTAQDLVPHD